MRIKVEFICDTDSNNKEDAWAEIFDKLTNTDPSIGFIDNLEVTRIEDASNTIKEMADSEKEQEAVDKFYGVDDL